MLGSATVTDMREKLSARSRALWPRGSATIKDSVLRETGITTMPGWKFSFIEKFALLTGCNDTDIATMLDMPRSTVQAYRTHRLDEQLSDKQKETLLKAAQSYRQQVYEVVAEMELYT